MMARGQFRSLVPDVAAVMSALLSLLACSACGATSTDACTASSQSLTGVYTYDGARDTPTQATFSGTLSLTGQSCNNFTGTIDFVEVDAQGQSRRLSGPVSGTLLSATSLQLDAGLGAVVRQHIAKITPDSVYGTWVEMSGSITGSGRFRTRRGGTS